MTINDNINDNINDQINESSRSSITTNCYHSDSDNNTPSNTYNNIVMLGNSIPKSKNIWNLNTRLSTANYKYRFFGYATSKHFYHYIQPTLKENKRLIRYCCSAHGEK